MYNNTQYCKSLNKTCCRLEDFELMRQKWQGKLSANKTEKEEKEEKKEAEAKDEKEKDAEKRKDDDFTIGIRGKRASDMLDLKSLVDNLRKWDKKFTEFANIIKKRGGKLNGDAACMISAHSQSSISELQLLNAAYLQYNQTSFSCWNHTKNYMNALMCAACDSNAQNFIDMGLKKLTISKDECNKFIKVCGEHIMAIESVHYYLDTIYTLTFCDFDGNFEIFEIPEDSEMSATLLSSTQNCLNFKNPDECAAICRSQLGFTTMLDYEFESKKLIDKFVKKIKKFYEELDIEKGKIEAAKRDEQGKAAAAKKSKEEARKKAEAKKKRDEERRKEREQAKKEREQNKKKKSSRRVLEDDKKTNDLYQALNELKVEVKKAGIDLSEYTEDNKDGYLDINVTKIFSAQFLSSLGLLSALALAMLS